MGAWGAVIMGFFGAVFAALTLHSRWGLSGLDLAPPFVVFAAIGVVSGLLLRQPGDGVRVSERAGRVIMWSTMAEGVGLFLAANLVTNLHRPDLLLPAMALVVGLHFLPIASAASFRPFRVLGGALILCAVVDVVLGAPEGGALAGVSAAGCLWVAAILALRRDWRSKLAGRRT